MLNVLSSNLEKIIDNDIYNLSHFLIKEHPFLVQNKVYTWILSSIMSRTMYYIRVI